MSVRQGLILLPMLILVAFVLSARQWYWGSLLGVALIALIALVWRGWL